MQPEPSFVDWLGALDEQALTDLLTQRPDATVPPAPLDLTELADRLSGLDSLVAAVLGLGQPALDVLTALMALGGSATVGRTCELLAPTSSHRSVEPAPGTPRATRDQLARPLARLQAVGLVWPDGDRLRTQPGLRDILTSPFGFGPTLEQLLADDTVARLQQLQARLGLPKGGNKASVVNALADHLSRPEVVRALVAEAPAQIGAQLQTMAEPGAEVDLVGSTRQAWAVRQQAISWGTDHGLLYSDNSWGFASRPQMPAQVALALLGDDFAMPFHCDPPSLVLVEVRPERVRADAAAAVTELDQHAVGLLDRLAREPATALKSGGIGTRELTRLAKASRADPTEVRLVLELAGLLDLLELDGRELGVSAAYRAWRAGEPGQRLATLLATWLSAPLCPTAERGDDGRPRPALAGADDPPVGPMSRHALLAALGLLEPARSVAKQSLVDFVAWSQPFAAAENEAGESSLELAWREAELLGVLADGSMSPLGRALVGEDRDRLVDVAAGLLPGTTDSARFGTDLTAMVIGSPGPVVTALLDSIADREKAGGGATMWRFSPASVRRAMDHGASGDELLARLDEVAQGELPQPLRYLVGDVGRRHGRLRVRSAAGVIRCADEGLLAEVAADRRLRKLNPQLVAPTVLVCDAPVEEALAALRAAGYFPMPESDAGGAAGSGAAAERPIDGTGPTGSDRRAEQPSDEKPADEVPDNVYDLFARAPGRAEPAGPVVREPTGRASAAEVAAQLAGRVSVPARLGDTERKLAGLTRRLTGAQRRQLAFALDHEWPAQLTYRTKAGRTETRVFWRMQLLGTAIVGYSADSHEQWARVDGILDVAIVDPNG